MPSQRPNLATVALLIIALLVGIMIALGFTGHLPRWLIGLTLVL